MSAYEVPTRKVRFSEELALSLADRVEWGEPDADGFYEPVLTRDFDKWATVRAEARATVLADAIQRVEGLPLTVEMQCGCDNRWEREHRDECNECGHPLTDHPNGWSCSHPIRRPENVVHLYAAVLAILRDLGDGAG